MPVYERTPKNSHLDTIWYEIDMLEFAFRKLKHEPPALASPDWNLLIEGFLLHYRNLIQFFSGSERKHRRGSDLSFAEPDIWADRALQTSEIDAIRRPARELEDKYWDDISQFLQHCTVRRYRDSMEWNLLEMYGRITEIIQCFAQSFPRPDEKPQPVTLIASLRGASTATVSTQQTFIDSTLFLGNDSDED